MTMLKTEPPSSPDHTLIVDSRETNSGIMKMLTEAGVPFRSEQLACGDYKTGPYLIERKAVSDLVISIMDGRLFEQAEAICGAAERPMLLIEGDLRQHRSQLSEESLLGAISSITVFWGIQLVALPDAMTTSRFVARLHQHVTKGLGYEIATRVAKPKIAPPDGALSQYLVCGLPGVGPELARKLLLHFGSAQAVFMADEEALRKCKGCGAITAQKIVQALKMRPTTFRSTVNSPF